jgi:hypothetical protein
MAFPFGLLCNLLDKLDRNRTKMSIKSSKAKHLDVQTVISWLNEHDGIIPREGPAAFAYLSCRFLERKLGWVFDLTRKKSRNHTPPLRSAYSPEEMSVAVVRALR